MAKQVYDRGSQGGTEAPDTPPPAAQPQAHQDQPLEEHPPTEEGGASAGAQQSPPPPAAEEPGGLKELEVQYEGEEDVEIPDGFDFTRKPPEAKKRAAAADPAGKKKPKQAFNTSFVNDRVQELMRELVVEQGQGNEGEEARLDEPEYELLGE